MTGEPAKNATRALRADAWRNHERIIRAAIELLAEHPAATMEELTAATGLGRTTVYRHFHTREHLVAEVYRASFAGARRVFAEAGLESCPTAELLGRAVAAGLAAVRAYPVLINGPGLDVGVGGGLNADYTDCLDALAVAMGRAQRAGLLDPALPPRWLANSLLDDCAGAALFAAELRGCGRDPQELVVEAFRRAWGGRLAGAGPAR
ncbi:TetR/AcrR family transcriptional regulator [Marinactinospora rubrisoli]|uniref:TetR/AcrR family transcriptional regulator n=1 Tax=Marinactinospora rubrisoli TaxID=2715399 RepID=A0ABW2KPA6_9ACTN